MTSSQVLIVEDEPDIAELIRFHAEREGCRARVVGSGRTALDAIKRAQPDIVVLDLMLPDVDGLEICRRLKWEKDTRGIPVLIVSAKGDEADIVAGLELGADDYVTKPFSPRVLLARMKNILRRGEENGTESPPPSRVYSLASGALVIDLERHTVTADGEPVELTRTEFAILACLAARPGFVRTRDQIIAAVHGDSAVLTRRTVDVHVTSIRRKLGAQGQLLQTVRGVGYRMQQDAAGSDE